ncbi:hypothetical protein C0Q70_16686 [Pomacea canaliculata]|uniref:Uncharacterized protein n=1 Tax=Pomacea canaliculata TaxID=400727 RepID=A0A2T7NQG8_POMCA|nr:hypothetical protein C0Q70_16686 [Pomacea canaliculata]
MICTECFHTCPLLRYHSTPKSDVTSSWPAISPSPSRPLQSGTRYQTVNVPPLPQWWGPLSLWRDQIKALGVSPPLLDFTLGQRLLLGDKKRLNQGMQQENEQTETNFLSSLSAPFLPAESLSFLVITW